MRWPLVALLVVLAGCGKMSEQAWVAAALRELRAVGGPGGTPGGVAPYAYPSGHIVFGDGTWVVGRSTTVHDADGPGDVAVLLASDGRVFVSHDHYCVGLDEMVHRREQPATIEDFLATGGFSWVALSADP